MDRTSVHQHPFRPVVHEFPSGRTTSPQSVHDFESVAQILARMTTKEAAPHKARRLSPWIIAAVILGTVDVVAWYLALRTGFYVPGLGLDLETYRAAAQSFLDGAGFYQPWQFAPYGMASQPIMYPPATIPLFAAFTVLPSVLWWAIPLGVLAARFAPTGLLARSRRIAPHPLRWGPRVATTTGDDRGYTTGRPESGQLRRAAQSSPRILLVLACLAWPQTAMLVWAGNPAMWIAMFAALGWGPLVLLKPTLAPFALVGFGSRKWWIGAAILATMSLPFVGMLPDYVTVLLNARDGQGWFYHLGNVPLMLVGLVAQQGPEHSRLRLHRLHRLGQRGRGEALVRPQPR